ncbi:MAG: hypothetical protein HYV27_12570 [Candidatus Hydrogenedentes bacterium]|nr:hypothetical protein [Candidatus Hydrogenedentota bacterium]
MPMSALRLGQHAAESGAIVPEIGKVTEDSRWFILLAGVNVYPKLESERLIREYFDPAMKLLSPGYDRVTIISDLRDRHLLWPPHFGVGYTLGKHFSAFVQGGYSAGKVRTEQNDPSIILLPLHTDFEIKRGAGFVGLGLDYFPLGMPRKQHYEGWLERLQAARPSLGVRATWTHAFFTAKVKVGFQPVIPLVSLRLKDSWDLWSVNFNGGLDVPLTQRSVFTMNGGYNFFEGETGDFNSASFTFGWKYYFR